MRKIKKKFEKKKEKKVSPELKPTEIKESIDEKEISEIIDIEKEEKQEEIEKAHVRFNDVQKKVRRVGVKTVVVEKREQKEEGIKIPAFAKKKDALMIPVKIREQIEKFILKILYEDKAVKSIKLLIDKVLERCVDEKIVITEKDISLIIHQMDKDDKIQFTQKEGWKIKI
jgi:hypothetical protein